MLFVHFIGAMIQADDGAIRARAQINEGKKRTIRHSRKAFNDMGQALNYGNKWVKRARRIWGWA